MNIKYFVSITILAGLLAGCGSAVLKPQVGFDLSAKPEFVAKDFTSEQDGSKLKGTKKIIITDFVVEFENELKKVETKSTFSNGSAGAGSKIELTGMPNDVLQKIADQAYDNMVNDLKAMGYQVQGPADLAGNEFYKGLLARKEKASPSKYSTVSGESLLFSPHSFALYLPPGDYSGKRAGSMSNVFGNLGNNAKNINENEQEIADKENAAVLKVWLSVGFGNNGTNVWVGDTGAGGASSAVAQLFIRGEGISRLAFRTPGANAKRSGFASTPDSPSDGSTLFTLSKSLFADEDYLAAGQERVQQGGNSTLSMLASGQVMGALTGTRTFEMKADPGKFSAIASKHLDAARKLLLARLKNEAN